MKVISNIYNIKSTVYKGRRGGTVYYLMSAPIRKSRGCGIIDIKPPDQDNRNSSPWKHHLQSFRWEFSWVYFERDQMKSHTPCE